MSLSLGYPASVSWNSGLWISWNGSQAGEVSWPLSQFLWNLCPSISGRQDILLVECFVAGFESHSFHFQSCWLQAWPVSYSNRTSPLYDLKNQHHTARFETCHNEVITNIKKYQTTKTGQATSPKNTPKTLVQMTVSHHKTHTILKIKKMQLLQKLVLLKKHNYTQDVELQ